MDYCRAAWHPRTINSETAMREVTEKHIVVAGAARSGVAVACLLQRKGADIFASDHSVIADSNKKRLTNNGIPFEENGHTHAAKQGEFLVVSPGVPTQSPIVQHYLNSGKKVYSEIEVASWFNHSSILAVTGSNGKTTVTNWLDHTWKIAKRDHLLGGNIGVAFSDTVEESSPGKQAILEVSSFQLDHIDTFRPQIGLILNITPDHLDRYDHDIQQYAASKFRITENQQEEDYLIYHFDDPIIRDHVKRLKKRESAPRILAFSHKKKVPRGAYVLDQKIIINLNDEEEVLMPTSEIGLKGRHNLNNGLATALAARVSEINNEIIRESLRTFEGVQHRLEPVRTVGGVKYINDSKATNINAVWYALDSFNTPIVLILGGRDKGNDYSELADQIRKKVHTVIAIGEARPLIEEQLKDVVPQLNKAATMEEAIRTARNVAKKGELVLLSPACSSFDMFENYEHRGNEFKRIVNNL